MAVASVSARRYALGEMPSFYWVTCQPGFEPVLKRDLARERPAWKFAYSRPGFLTFKDEQAPEGVVGEPLHSPFARASGLTLGKAATEDEVLAFARGRAGTGGTLQRLHVFAREAEGPLADALVPLETRLRASGLFESDPEARKGESVLDVISVDEGVFWLGEHVAQPQGPTRWPGGLPRFQMPEDAPSRAWMKAEEAIRVFSVPIRAGDIAVEVGCAPGGVVWNLLGRGLRVCGVDSADMDPRLAGNRDFRHVRASAENAFDYLMPERVDWWLMDMNAGPEIALRELLKLIRRIEAPPRMGVLLTLKLNDPRAASRVDRVAAEARAALGLATVQLRQLHANRSEVTLYGLAPAALLR